MDFGVPLALNSRSFPPFEMPGSSCPAPGQEGATLIVQSPDQSRPGKHVLQPEVPAASSGQKLLPLDAPGTRCSLAMCCEPVGGTGPVPWWTDACDSATI